MESKLEYRDLALGTCCYPKENFDHNISKEHGLLSTEVVIFVCQVAARSTDCKVLSFVLTVPSTEVSRELTSVSISFVAELFGLPSLRFTTSASCFMLNA